MLLQHTGVWRYVCSLVSKPLSERSLRHGHGTCVICTTVKLTTVLDQHTATSNCADCRSIALASQRVDMAPYACRATGIHGYGTDALRCFHVQILNSHDLATKLSAEPYVDSIAATLASCGVPFAQTICVPASACAARTFRKSAAWEQCNAEPACGGWT